jgi:hypothetical protein
MFTVIKLVEFEIRHNCIFCTRKNISKSSKMSVCLTNENIYSKCKYVDICKCKCTCMYLKKICAKSITSKIVQSHLKLFS